jgi:hypothetical protein
MATGALDEGARGVRTFGLGDGRKSGISASGPSSRPRGPAITAPSGGAASRPSCGLAVRIRSDRSLTCPLPQLNPRGPVCRPAPGARVTTTGRDQPGETTTPLSEITRLLQPEAPERKAVGGWRPDPECPALQSHQVARTRPFQAAGAPRSCGPPPPGGGCSAEDRSRATASCIEGSHRRRHGVEHGVLVSQLSFAAGDYSAETGPTRGAASAAASRFGHRTGFTEADRRKKVPLQRPARPHRPG